ncbi:MAG: hypothetical protein ABL899_02410 [Nitrospira sp.]
MVKKVLGWIFFAVLGASITGNYVMYQSLQHERQTVRELLPYTSTNHEVVALEYGPMDAKPYPFHFNRVKVSVNGEEKDLIIAELQVTQVVQKNDIGYPDGDYVYINSGGNGNPSAFPHSSFGDPARMKVVRLNTQ